MLLMQRGADDGWASWNGASLPGATSTSRDDLHGLAVPGNDFRARAANDPCIKVRVSVAIVRSVMDPLSDVLSLLKPRSQFYAGMDAAGDWAFDFPPHEGIKFTAVIRGTCWGLSDGLEQPVRFDEGDCFLLNSGRRFVLSSDPALPPRDAGHILEAATREGVAVHNGGGEVFLISGRFDFSGSHAAVLFEALPPLINIPKASSQAEILRWSLDQLTGELHDPQPGGALLSTHLVHLMLVQVLRLFLKSSPDLPRGWFLALTDRQISQALKAMHADPARHWTLEELARQAGVSRTVFAQRFKALVGTTAIDYLSRWRMLVAADRLRNGDDSVSAIAFSLGYDSESAFSAAFKRVMACSPTKYRRQASARPRPAVGTGGTVGTGSIGSIGSIGRPVIDVHGRSPLVS
ncbi:MAG: AraC family transcriptional regulator [Burkholderiaceae bacterium]